MPKGIYERTDKHKRLMIDGWSRRNGVETSIDKCKQCGKEIIVYVSRLKRGRSKYCSIGCASHSPEKHLCGDKNPNWRGGRHFNKDGYVMIRRVGHKRANPAGYVREHILVAERVINKDLSDKAVIHHVNGDRSDNRCSNLVICENRTYHSYLHGRSGK